jgi:hypothetical protein
VAGRLDGAAALQMIEEFLPQDARDKLHVSLKKKFGPALSMDFVTKVLPNLGPDLGLCVAPSSTGKAIPDVLVALKIQPGSPENPVDQAVMKALHFFAVAAVIDFNGKQDDFDSHIKIKSQSQDTVEVKYLTHPSFPDGFQPALALKEGYLVLASSPAALQRFGQSPAVVKGTPLFHLSFPELTQFLNTNRKWLLENALDKTPFPPQAAGNWLDNVLEVLNLLDNLHLQQDLAPGQVTWSLRLQMKPAAK